MNTEKKNETAVKKPSLNKKYLKIGSFSITMTAVVIAVVIIVNMFIAEGKIARGYRNGIFVEYHAFGCRKHHKDNGNEDYDSFELFWECVCRVLFEHQSVRLIIKIALLGKNAQKQVRRGVAERNRSEKNQVVVVEKRRNCERGVKLGVSANNRGNAEIENAKENTENR